MNIDKQFTTNYKLKQKIPRLSFVYVSKDMPDYMRHFDCGFYGVVKETYSQFYGGECIDGYSIFKIENNKIVKCMSWYEENQLTLLNFQDPRVAEAMIEEYRMVE